MIPKEYKRLAEVDLPIARVSVFAREEKGTGVGWKRGRESISCGIKRIHTPPSKEGSRAFRMIPVPLSATSPYLPNRGVTSAQGPLLAPVLLICLDCLSHDGVDSASLCPGQFIEFLEVGR